MSCARTQGCSIARRVTDSTRVRVMHRQPQKSSLVFNRSCSNLVLPAWCRWVTTSLTWRSTRWWAVEKTANDCDYAGNRRAQDCVQFTFGAFSSYWVTLDNPFWLDAALNFTNACVAYLRDVGCVRWLSRPWIRCGGQKPIMTWKTLSISLEKCYQFSVRPPQVTPDVTKTFTRWQQTRYDLTFIPNHTISYLITC